MENLEAGLINCESLVQYSSVHKEIQLHLQRRLKLSCMSTLSDVTCVQHDGKYLVHCTPLVNFGAIEDIHSDFFSQFAFIFCFHYFFLHENQLNFNRKHK